MNLKKKKNSWEEKKQNWSSFSKSDLQDFIQLNQLLTANQFPLDFVVILDTPYCCFVPSRRREFHVHIHSFVDNNDVEAKIMAAGTALTGANGIYSLVHNNWWSWRNSRNSNWLYFISWLNRLHYFSFFSFIFSSTEIYILLIV